MVALRVGISGWTYAPWRGIFYPPKLAQRLELEYASRQVNSIEINGTFYRLQKPESFRQWYGQTPANFCFAIKATQFITHRLRLKDAAQPLANFFASGLLCLKEKLGPILWQFPPNLPLVDDRFVEFMKLLPQTAREAAALAKRHDDFIKDRSHTEVDGDFPIRHAFEFRHPSFRDADFLASMRRYNVALVFADAGERATGLDDITSNFVYMRMHGQGKDYENGYSEAALAIAKEKILAWQAGKQPAGSRCLLPEAKPKSGLDVFVYFDNDEKAHAPLNARRLSELLDIKREEAA